MELQELLQHLMDKRRQQARQMHVGTLYLLGEDEKGARRHRQPRSIIDVLLEGGAIPILSSKSIGTA